VAGTQPATRPSPRSQPPKVREACAMAVSSVVSFLAKGGPVMIPLTVCSVLSLAVILERAWFWVRAARAHEEEHVLELVARGEWDDAMEAGRAARSPAARVLV